MLGKVFSIDELGTRIIDDCLRVTRDGTDTVVEIFIADVTDLAPRGSTLEQIALVTGFQNRTDRILPEEVRQLFESTGRRPCFAIRYALHKNGEVSLLQITREQVVLEKALSFCDIELIMANRDEPWRPFFHHLAQVVLLQLAKQRAQGALQIEDCGCSWQLNGPDQMVRNSQIDRVSIGKIVVTGLLAIANQLLGSLAAERHIPTIFEYQEWRGNKAEIDGVRTDCRQLQPADIQSDSDYDRWQYRIARILHQQQFSPATGRCYSQLGSVEFATFTRPLRAFPSLVNLANLRRYLEGVEGEGYPYPFEFLPALVCHLNDRMLVRRERQKQDKESSASRTRRAPVELVERLYQETEPQPIRLAREWLRELPNRYTTPSLYSFLSPSRFRFLGAVQGRTELLVRLQAERKVYIY